VQDPLSNPIIENILSLYGPAAAAYKIGTGIGNTVLHYQQAMYYEEDAAESRAFLIMEDQRGMKQGKGYSVDVDARRNDILADLNNHNTDNATFVYTLMDLINGIWGGSHTNVLFMIDAFSKSF
jgi:hypothetical protein